MIGRAYTRLDKGENLYVRLDRRSGDNLLAHQYGRERRAVQQISRPSQHLHRNFLVGLGRKVVWVYNGQVGGVCRGYGYDSARERRDKDGKYESIVQSWSSRKAYGTDDDFNLRPIWREGSEIFERFGREFGSVGGWEFFPS